MQRDKVILSAYREAVLAAGEKGLKGPAVAAAAVRVAAKVASRLLGAPVTEDEVRQVVGR